MKPQFDFMLCKDARKLVEDNIGLVPNVVRTRFRRCSMPFEDLVQEGYFGLMSAAHYFYSRRHSLQCKFSTFAVPRIVERLKYVLKGNADKRIAFHIEEMKKLYYTENGEELTNESLSDIFGISMRKILEITSGNHKQINIDNLTNIEEDNTFDTLLQDDKLSPLNLLVLKEGTLLAAARKRLQKLRKVQRLRKTIGSYNTLNPNV